jgi:NAD(P)H dehydrogenase (quinone)
MKALIILAHPSPNSFIHAISESCQKALGSLDAEVVVKDLYEMGFNPVLTAEDLARSKQGTPSEEIRQEQEDIEASDLLIFTYPVWWYDRPAILKGWIDRVFSYGFAYRATDRGIEGLLKGKKSLIFQTTGDPQKKLEETGAIDIIEKSMTEGTLKFCGMTEVQMTTFFGVPRATADQREQMLKVAERLTHEAASSF